jgi:murein L,D-transpeptidase YcbB/YkuD
MGMRGHYLIATLLSAAQAFALLAAGSARAEEAAMPAADRVVAIIRAKLVDPDLRKDANADDLAALKAFYAARTGAPLWMTDMGFSKRGQAALFEIEKADDWGLDAKAFALPPAGALPEGEEAEALAEIKLDLAILKYARFARGGRFNPSELSDAFDQKPPLLDPEVVLTEIEAAEEPDAYLRSLHPKHEQFVRLHQALLKVRGEGEDGAKGASSEQDIRRIIINMERWRWMPEDLGPLYVWINVPAFELYVVKDGKTIYADKTQVGTIAHPTPVFSADMKTIVFNPEWIAPRTVLVESLLPALRRKNYGILTKHGFSVSYQGRPVNATKVDWGRVNILDYTFIQRPGPASNLGKVKFLFPNKHAVYMHDTFAARRKVFDEKMRAIGYGCVRMEKPEQLAELLLAEDKGWPASEVKALWDKAVNSPVTIDHKLPVHTTYFTAVVDETGEVATFPDIYGLDHKLAAALFNDTKGFPMPAPEPNRLQTETARVKWMPNRSGIASSVEGFLDN